VNGKGIDPGGRPRAVTSEPWGVGELDRLDWIGPSPEGMAAFSARQAKFVLISGDVEHLDDRITDREAVAQYGLASIPYVGGFLESGEAVFSIHVGGTRPRRLVTGSDRRGGSAAILPRRAGASARPLDPGARLPNPGAIAVQYQLELLKCASHRFLY
jgi:hypothetical protein